MKYYMELTLETSKPLYEGLMEYYGEETAKIILNKARITQETER